MKPLAKATRKQAVLEFPLNADTAQEAIALIVDNLDEHVCSSSSTSFTPRSAIRVPMTSIFETRRWSHGLQGGCSSGGTVPGRAQAAPRVKHCTRTHQKQRVTSTVRITDMALLPPPSVSE